MLHAHYPTKYSSKEHVYVFSQFHNTQIACVFRTSRGKLLQKRVQSREQFEERQKTRRDDWARVARCELYHVTHNRSCYVTTRRRENRARFGKIAARKRESERDQTSVRVSESSRASRRRLRLDISRRGRKRHDQFQAARLPREKCRCSNRAIRKRRR